MLVDEVLKSRHFGARLARVWLDVVRYSDGNGFQRDEFRPNAWRYRDYVIRSFNADKPYDEFIREQLAGDELLTDRYDQADVDRLIATGFMQLGKFDSEQGELAEISRDRFLGDLANTTAAAFLGQTFPCAQCHDLEELGAVGVHSDR